MNVGERLRDLRTTKNLSQGDIEKRTGLLRCYISRVENGWTVPNLDTLERIVEALGIELYQLFYEGDGKPAPVSTHHAWPLGRGEAALLHLYRILKKSDRGLVLQLARDLAKNVEA